MNEQAVEMAHMPRCPGCGHSCCLQPGLECGGDSDVVQACDAACRWCGWLLKWPLSHESCGPNMPVGPHADHPDYREEWKP